MVHEVTAKSLEREIVVSTFHPSLKIGLLISFQRSAQKATYHLTRQFFELSQVRIYLQGTGFLRDEESGSRISQGSSDGFQYDILRVIVRLQARIVWMCVAMQDCRYLR
jgi:hypothetical protein